jgi:hypothetical protein
MKRPFMLVKDPRTERARNPSVPRPTGNRVVIRNGTKAIPKLVEASSHEELVDALNKHLAQTQQHVKRLEQAFATLGEEAEEETCAGMKGLRARRFESARPANHEPFT